MCDQTNIAVAAITIAPIERNNFRIVVSSCSRKTNALALRRARRLILAGFLARADGASCEADKNGENKFRAEFAGCQRDQCSAANG